MNWSGEQDRRLIEDQLPLDVLNAIFAKEKLHPRHYVSLNPLLAGRADKGSAQNRANLYAKPFASHETAVELALAVEEDVVPPDRSPESANR